MSRARTTAALLLTLLATGPLLAQDDPAELVRRERQLGVMGTDLVIEVLGPDPQVLEDALDAAEAELRRVEDVFTTWRESPLTRLNDAAGQGPQRVDPEVAELIARALELGQLTEGAFDVTFGSAGRLWNYRADPPVVPTADEVTRALERVDYRRVRVDLEASTVELPEGFSIGLGGIAKGYGVDRAMALIMERGIRHAIVNAGGDLKALGRNQGELWQIAIKHPRNREWVLAMLPVSNTCVVTSGDYERFFEHDGQRYHHILDPRTGYPSTGCMSATVVAPDAAYADALATALCVLGPEAGLELIERLRRTEAIVVGMDGEVRMSTGLQGR
jgi:FAD:protein FMN transferase